MKMRLRRSWWNSIWIWDITSLLGSARRSGKGMGGKKKLEGYRVNIDITGFWRPSCRKVNRLYNSTARHCLIFSDDNSGDRREASATAQQS
ncbi:hypothetical protein KFU94_57750 [Chloroflexi bacterium TSY]|nr:hypothetical protein [Chloroflexi bacterium TSY]